MFFITLSGANIIALLTAVVCSQILGMVWYSNALFGPLWRQLVGITPDMMVDPILKKKMRKNMLWGPVISLVTTYVLAVLVNDLLIHTLWSALGLGLFVWVGFSGAAVGMNYLYNPKLNLKLFMVDAGYHLSSLMVMSVILSMFIY